MIGGGDKAGDIALIVKDLGHRLLGVSNLQGNDGTPVNRHLRTGIVINPSA